MTTTTLTLTRSQAQLLENAQGPVAICNESGRQVGFIVFESEAAFDADLAPERAEELVRRMSMPDAKWLTMDELLDDSDERAAGRCGRLSNGTSPRAST